MKTNRSQQPRTIMSQMYGPAPKKDARKNTPQKDRINKYKAPYFK